MIVVADDLGGDTVRNRAIIAALDAGIVDAASVLAGGAAFDEAATLAQAHAARVGVHLNLTDGAPLIDAARLRRFCDADGRYRLWRGAERAIHLDRQERAAVAAELRAQVDRARSAGFAVPHLDSHHHVHTEPALAPIVIELAHELGVPRVRLARNCGGGMGPANRAWKAVFNARLRRAGLAGTHWFGGVEDVLHLRARRPGVDDVEVMVHPVLGPRGALEDADARRPLGELLDFLARPA